MRLGKKLGLLALLAGLALALTACPGVESLGGLDIAIDARSDRCDDGVKVVVEGIQEEWGFGEMTFGDNVRDHGPNWIWVEPGMWGSMLWDVPVSSPATTQPEGKQITVKAYCMRTSGEPGLSQRDFPLSDHIKRIGLPAYNVLSMVLYVRDGGSDPDYTVAPPGLTITDQQ